MSRIAIAVVLLALLLSAVAVQAGEVNQMALSLKTAIYLARGDTGLASANDGGAIAYNPANLASVSITNYSDDPFRYGGDPKPVKTECVNSIAVSGDSDFWSLFRAIRDVRKDWGIGLGYVNLSTNGTDSDWWTVGFGSRIADSNWNAGLALQHVDAGLMSTSAKNLINLGVQGTVYERDGESVQVGALVRDLTGRLAAGPLYNVGVAGTFKDTLVEINWWDMTDQIQSSVNIGVQQKLDSHWSLYGGLIDGDDLTAGVGFIDGWWNLAAGWRQTSQIATVSDEVIFTAGRRIQF